MKKSHFFTILISLCCSLSFAQETLTVYKKTPTGIDENTPAGSLVFTDQIKELPLPMDSVKKVMVVKDTIQITDRKGNVKKDKKGRPKIKVKKRRVTIWEKVEPKEPPRFVPIQCKLGEVWVKRADLARFQQASMDLSGEYASATGSVFLKKSPTNPRYFSFVIQNGPFGYRAELEASNLELREANGHARLTYSEEGCTVDIAVADRKVRVAQRGCNEYNSGKYKLEGE